MALVKRYHVIPAGISGITQNDGTVASGTAGEINTFIISPGSLHWELFNLGTNTVLSPIMNTTVGVGGLDIQLTDTDAQGAVFTPGGNHHSNPLAMVIGTDPAFFLKVRLRSEDWSSHRVMVGWHGGAANADIQAHQSLANIAAYTDKYLIGQYTVDGVDVTTSTALNNAADSDVDTMINLTDGDVAEFTVAVSATGVVTPSLRLAATATPTTFVAQTLTEGANDNFTFDTGDVVVPMIYTIADGDGTNYLSLLQCTIGYQ
jgi:hypothetical protein